MDIGDRDGAALAGDLSVLSHGDQIEHSVRVKHDILAFKSPGAGKPRARAIGRPLRGGANRAYRLHVVPVEREQRNQVLSPPFQTWVRWQTPVYMLRQRLGFFENEFPGRRSRVPRSRCSRHRFGRAHHVGMGTKSDHEHLRKYWCRAGRHGNDFATPSNRRQSGGEITNGHHTRNSFYAIGFRDGCAKGTPGANPTRIID
jgi:hypothetical protein